MKLRSYLTDFGRILLADAQAWRFSDNFAAKINWI